MRKTWMLTAVTAAILASGSAWSQGPGTPEMTPPAKTLAEDKNHDGVITRDEVKPGTNLAKRFDERDADHDGKLSQDEYFMPPGTGANESGMNNPSGTGPAQQPSSKGSPVQGMAPGGADQGRGGDVQKGKSKTVSGSGANSNTAAGSGDGDGHGSGSGGH